MNHAIPELRKKWGVARGAAFVLNALPPAAALSVGSHGAPGVPAGIVPAAILYIVFLLAIARWKKWGVYGLAALYVVVTVAETIAYLRMPSMDFWKVLPMLLSTLLFWAIFPTLIFASVYSKWDQME